MSETQIFSPPRTTGFLLHAVILLLLLGGASASLIMAFSGDAGWRLILYLLGALVLIALTPFAAYRVYALLHASYTIERDGLRVRWGLRSEDLPISEVIWVRPIADLAIPLRLPRFSGPGAILGNSEHPELGRVEFIASSLADMVVVSAINKTLVLSPQDPVEFCARFERVIEMGSLSPIGPYTAQPAAFLTQVLDNHLARVLLGISTGFTFLLLVVTSLLLPQRELISLGYDANGLPLDLVPAPRLLLLPIIGILFLTIDLITGFFFFRRPETRLSAYFVWAAGSVTALILLAAVLVIFFRPV